MTAYIDIKPGQWVLAFDDRYGLYDPEEKSMAEHLEMFAHRGGGWTSFRHDQMFLIHQPEKVSDKTYLAEGKRHPRFNVIAVARSEAELLQLRDDLMAIGEKTDDLIEDETARRMAAFTARTREKARKAIRRKFPAVFKGEVS